MTTKLSDRWQSPVTVLLFAFAFLLAYRFHMPSVEVGSASFWLPDAVLLCGVLVLIYQQRSKQRESDLRFRSLVDVAPVMLWMSGTDARCTFFNKPWLEFTGLSFKEQVEQDWVGRIHPEDRERCVNQYLSAFKSRQKFTSEYRLLRYDGVYRWVLHDGVPRYADDGTFLGYIGSRLDFTDRREVEEQLRKVSAQLLEAQAIDRYRIAYALHDDLAQRVCALTIHLNTLSHQFASDGLATAFDELQRQMRDVCKEIARLSYQLSPETIRGLSLTSALRNLCQQSEDATRTVLFVQNADLPPIPLHVSQSLYRIAQKSLKNSLTHSRATSIQVELSASATNIRLTVRDNGCGFVVGSNTNPGLGLSAMSERMRSAGGIFKITSNPGEGTAVVATVPLVQSMTSSARA